MASLLPTLTTAAASPVLRTAEPARATMAHPNNDGRRVLRKELRAEKHAIKRRLVSNNMAGLFDFVSQGFSVVKDLAPAALKANIEKKIATTQAKAAERVAAANERAAASAVSVNTLQPTPAQPVQPAMDWKKPALIAGGVVGGLLLVSRLMPARSAQ